MTERPVWTRHEIEILINLYHSKPELWNPKSKEYRDKFKKRQTLIQIANAFNVSPDEITRKIHNLRTQFNDALKKTMKRSNSCEVFVTKWPYFKSLMFLKESILGTKETGPLTNDNQVETVEDKDSESYDEKSVDVYFEQQPKIFKTDTSDITDNNDNMDNTEILKRALHYESNGNNDTIQRTMHATYVAEEDHYDIFGKFVASEIKNLPSDMLRRKMKRKIQQVILDINEEAEQYL